MVKKAKAAVPAEVGDVRHLSGSAVKERADGVRVLTSYVEEGEQLVDAPPLSPGPPTYVEPKKSSV